MSKPIRIVRIRSSVIPSALDYDLVVDLGQGPVSCSVTAEANLELRRPVANLGGFPGWIDERLVQAIRDSGSNPQSVLDSVVQELEQAPLCDADSVRQNAA